MNPVLPVGMRLLSSDPMKIFPCLRESVWKNGGKRMNLHKTVVVLLALLLAAMAMVPCVSAADVAAEQMNKWQDDHTITVTKTVSSVYSDGVLKTDTVYTGTELTKRFGIKEFAVHNELKVSSEDAEKLGLAADKAEKSSKNVREVFTAANDPPMLLSGYPTWIYEYSGGVYHQLTEPINMIWSGASLSTIKTEMTEKGWWDDIVEYTYYIYDGSWKADDGVAVDPLRLLGGDHIRLWQLNSGEIVGAAHEDSWGPIHTVVGLEVAEDRISAFYQDPDDTLWDVYSDDIYLGNSVSSPFSNAYAAYIEY